MEDERKMKILKTIKYNPNFERIYSLIHELDKIELSISISSSSQFTILMPPFHF